MLVQLKKLRLENFKSHKFLEVNFDDITKLIGRNGAGKSSISEAITWTLFNVDAVGNSKFDPLPINGDDEVQVKTELLVSVDGKDILFGRTYRKTNKYYINEAPEKATKYQELVENIFDKKMFMSLFNPNFFSSQKWQDQREFLLSFIPEPTNKEILVSLSKIDKDRLEEPIKKLDIEKLELLHRERARDKEKEFEKASERVRTYKEELDQIPKEPVDMEAIEKEIVELKKQLTGVNEVKQRIRNVENKRSQIQFEIEQIKREIDNKKNNLEKIKSTKIEESCRTCGQALNEDAVENTKNSLREEYGRIVQEAKDMQEKGKALVIELNEMPEIEQEPDVGEIHSKLHQLDLKTDNVDREKHLSLKVTEWEAKVKVAKEELVTSRVIVDAVKAFKAKRAELMVKKVTDLFSTISVRLFEEQKNGDLKDTFEIEMDGKPYRVLSTAEKIKCGLELINVLSEQSGIIAPTFIDNAESILSFRQPKGQLIMAVVQDKEFTIETEGLSNE